MKPTLLVLAFTLICVSLKSQNYEHILGDTSTTWNYIPMGYCDGTYTLIDSVIGDTIIKTIQYKKVGDIGFVREDTILGKAWFFDKVKGKEYLMYDISLVKNDTFYFYDYSDDSIALYVDTVYYVDGRKQIELSSMYVGLCDSEIATHEENLRFIEGVGTNAGLFYQGMHYQLIMSYLLCLKKDNIDSYYNAFFHGKCDIEIVDINSNTLINIRLYPNPTDNILNIEYDNVDCSETMMIVRNIQGQIVQVLNTKDSFVRLNIRDYKVGLYFLEIINNRNHVSTKFIKV